MNRLGGPGDGMAPPGGRRSVQRARREERERSIWTEPLIGPVGRRRRNHGWAGLLRWRTRRRGSQEGDPAKIADVLITLAGQAEPPLRFVAGGDAIPAVAEKGRTLIAQAEASRDLGGHLAHSDAS